MSLPPRCAGFTSAGLPCMASALEDSPYCGTHTRLLHAIANQQCEALTASGDQCQYRGSVRGLCGKHAKMDPSRVERVTDTPPPAVTTRTPPARTTEAPAPVLTPRRPSAHREALSRVIAAERVLSHARRYVQPGTQEFAAIHQATQAAASARAFLTTKP